MVEIREEGSELKSEGMEMDTSEEKVEGKPDKPFNINDLLNMKIKLKDDIEVFVFSYGPRTQDGGVRPLNCHLCRTGNLLKQKTQKAHAFSKFHKSSSSKINIDSEVYNKRAYQQRMGEEGEERIFFSIYPGENIPEVTPEYEDRIHKKAYHVYQLPENPEVLKTLNNEEMHEYNRKMPLMGLDYLFKMKSSETAIHYYCALCEIKIAGEGYQHVVGTTHQANYIVKHFPKLYEKVRSSLNEIRRSSQKERCIRDIFRKLYRKIETSKGNQKVNIIDYNYFQKNRVAVVKKCHQKEHYNEKSINITENEVSVLIRKALKGINFINPDLISLSKPDSGYRSKSDTSVERKKGKTLEFGEPPAKMRKSDIGPGTAQNWGTYRLMVGNILTEINATYKNYEMNPKSHPEYEVEWKNFWRRRCQQLRRDKIEPHYDDIKAEWAPFWIQRLRQYYAKDLASRKKEIKRILNLPFDARSPSPIRISTQLEIQQPLQNAPSSFQDQAVKDNPIVQNEPLSVISVMRLLSALEEQLGSLGSKAVQLLSRAVLCEKTNGNTDELLVDNDYYVFFVTVKEKFKGQLLANVVDPPKRQAITRIISDITEIIDLMERALIIEKEKKRTKELLADKMFGGNSQTQSENVFKPFDETSLNRNRGSLGEMKTSTSSRRRNRRRRSDRGVSNPSLERSSNTAGDRTISNLAKSSDISREDYRNINTGTTNQDRNSNFDNFSGRNDNLGRYNTNDNVGRNLNSEISNIERIEEKSYSGKWLSGGFSNFETSFNNTNRDIGGNVEISRSTSSGNNNSARNFGSNMEHKDLNFGRNLESRDNSSNVGRGFGGDSRFERNDNFNTFSSITGGNLQSNNRFTRGSDNFRSDFGTNDRNLNLGFNNRSDNYRSSDSFQRSNYGNTDSVQRSNYGNTDSVQRSNYGNTDSVQRSNYGNTDSVQRSNYGNDDSLQRSSFESVDIFQRRNYGSSDSFPRSNNDLLQRSNFGNTDTFQKSNYGNTDLVQRNNYGNNDSLQRNTYRSNDLFQRSNYGQRIDNLNATFRNNNDNMGRDLSFGGNNHSGSIGNVGGGNTGRGLGNYSDFGNSGRNPGFSGNNFGRASTSNIGYNRNY